MNKLVAIFLDQLAERFTALAAGLVSSRVASLHAADQAEQQSRLEDLAREYEAANKPHIAATLRQRAIRLASPDLAGEGGAFVQHVIGPQAPPTTDAAAALATELSRIPDFTSAAPKARKKRSSTDKPDLGLGDLNCQSAALDSQEPQACATHSVLPSATVKSSKP